MENKFERSIGFIGEEIFNQIRHKKLIIFGLGGVGGTCFEALLRTGFDNFVIVDFDKVSESNMNRQILFTSKDIGKNKVDCALKRAKSINENASIETINMKVDATNVSKVGLGDYIIDAIDDVNAKVEIARYANENNIPVIVSLGMANRISPSDVNITKLNRTTTDPLAKKVRYLFKENGVDISKINVAFSTENPKKDGTKLNSLMFVPSSAGLNIASYVLQEFINELEQEK